MQTVDRRRGAAILLSTAVLSVLAILAVAFVRMQMLEREASQSVVHAVRARWMVTAGLEFAVQALRQAAATTSYDAPDAPWVYAGEDLNGDGAGDPSEDVFEPAVGELNRLDCPLELALAPSFAHGSNAARIASGLRPVSATFPSASGSFGEAATGPAAWLPGSGTPPAGYLETTFTLKVVDCASQIDANGGRHGVDASGQLVPLASPTSYADRIAGMIDRLWLEIRTVAGLDARFDLTATLGKGLGTYLRDYCAAQGWGGGFASKADLQRAVRAVSADPAVATEVWRRVGPYLACHAWRDPTVVKPIPSDDAQRVGVRRYATIEREPRAPVNINTADARVLTAVLSGLSGRVRRDGRAGDVPPGGLYTPDRFDLVTLDATAARRLAAAIAAHRRGSGGSAQPFRNWDDVDAFISDRVSAGDLTVDQGHLVRAQIRPDTQLNKFNPDAPAYQPVDKTDLYDHRTEFCLSSMGFFEIESLGRVTWRSHVIAEAHASTLVRVYDVLVDTTYADFEQGQTGSGARRTEIRPGVASLAAASAAIQPYDGRVGIGLHRPAPQLPVKRRIDFDEEADCKHYDGDKTKWPRLAPLVGPPLQGTRLADGAYAEATPTRGTHPCFKKPRVEMKRGAFAFWYKPNWEIGTDTRVHSILDYNTLGKPGKPGKAEETFQLYYEGGATDLVAPYLTPKLRGPKIVLLFWDDKSEREVKIQVPVTGDDGKPLVKPREWMLFTLLWTDNAVSLSFVSRVFRPGSGGSGNSGQMVVIEDSSAFGGPLIVYRRLLDELGARGGAIWDPETAEGPGGDPGGPGGPGGGGGWGWLRQPLRFKFGKMMRFGGPLKTHGAAANPEEPDYGDPKMAPSDGTYDTFFAFEVEKAPSDIDPLDWALAYITRLIELARQGRYYNGASLDPASPRPLAAFDSRTLTATAGHPLGTISWRGLTPDGTSLAVRVLRESAPGVWSEVPDGGGPLTFTSSGACPIPRSAVDAGLPPARRRGAVRYRVIFVETTPEDEALVRSPLLEHVVVTVLSPPEHFEWVWR